MRPKSTQEILNSSGPGSPGFEEPKTSEQKDAIIASKSRFIDNMAYQIRTLSNAIIGFSDLLRQEELSDAQREYVTEIYSSGQGLAALVNDVLDLSKIENGQLEIETADCSLALLLEELKSLMTPATIEKGLDFKIETTGRLPSNVHTDPVRLRQCLINLVGNAIKFTDAGHVHVHAGMDCCDGRVVARFDVEDTGVGMPPDRLDKIFEPYAGCDEAKQSILASLSHGLVVNSGLAVANQIVQLLGGRIGVVSEPGRGSIFSLVVPVGLEATPGEKGQKESPASRTPVSGEQGAEATVSPRPVARRSSSSKIGQCHGRILLAEDQPSNQMVISLLLEAMGLQVDVAEDGRKAVEMAAQNPYDLILMDIRMPHMDGNEAVGVLRDQGLSCPIIALSAAGVQADDRFDDFMAKPVDSRALYEVMSRFLPAGAEPAHEPVRA